MRRSVRLITAVALAVTVGIGFGLSPYASTAPDGLNKVAADKAFDAKGETRSIQEDSPIAGYAFPGIGDERLAKGVAGAVGTLGVFAFGFGAARVLRRRRTESTMA